MPKPRTVLIWGQNDLLTKAMEMFLTAGEAEECKVIKLPGDQCFSGLVEHVQKIKPDLVILYEDKPGEDCGSLGQLMQEQPDLRMITVTLENNVMQVYSKRSVTVRQISDLLAVIEDRNFSENSTQKEVTNPNKPNPLAG